MSSGGGGATSSTVYQNAIPTWAEPYATRILGQAEAMTLGSPGKSGGLYQPYGGQRLAGLNTLQQQAITGIADLGPTAQTAEASNIASKVGTDAGDISYSPLSYQYAQPSYLSAQPSALNQYEMAGPQSVQAPSLPQYQMGAPQNVGISPLYQYKMDPAQQVGADQFTSQAAQQYMSPYVQNVINQQKLAAVQDYAKQIPSMQAAATRMGARGGTRAALLESEARRGLMGQLGGIEASGRQQAFQNAQQQFAADRAAAMQAQLANQQAGLTTGQQNLAALLGVQQLGTQAGLQAALANQQAQQQAAQTNLQALINQAQFGGQQGLQAALANQQAQQQTGQTNLQALINQAQFGGQQGLQAQLANQQAQLQAQQQLINQNQAGQAAEEQSRQFRANLGLQGLQQRLGAAQVLGGLGQQGFTQQQQALQAQQQAGAGMQQLEQQRLDQMYQEFLNQQRFPYAQLGFLSDILRGVPSATASQTLYQAPPSTLNTVAGLGSLAYGLGLGKGS